MTLLTIFNTHRWKQDNLCILSYLILVSLNFTKKMIMSIYSKKVFSYLGNLVFF